MRRQIPTELIDINAPTPIRAYLGTRIFALSSKWGMKEDAEDKEWSEKELKRPGFLLPALFGLQVPMREHGAVNEGRRGCRKA